MTFEIRDVDGRILTVRTIVGDGLAQVVVEAPEPVIESMEESE